MTNEEIIRAWKDEDYRNSLTDEQRALLPPNPIGAIELTDDDLDAVAGAAPTRNLPTCAPCTYNCD